jgi:hypothetical protein
MSLLLVQCGLLMVQWTAIFILVLLTGCTSQLQVLTEETNVILVSDFSNPVVSNPSNEELIIVPEAQDLVQEMPIVVVEEEVFKEDSSSEFLPQSVGVPITVEALVGQVNGRPIYANSVLEPIADLLRADSKKMNRTQFADATRKLLYYETESMGSSVRGGRVYELVITDLLLSEAMGNMSEEQSYGVFSMLGQMRENLASAQGGSQVQLRQRIEEQAGVSTEEFLGMQRDQILIDALQRQKIWPKVNVTWRDIQREFEKLSSNTSIPTQEMDAMRTQEILRNMQMGTPLKDITAAKGSVTLGKIRLAKDDERIQLVKDAFIHGMPFQEVALMVEEQDNGVWDSFVMENEGIAGIGIADTFKEKLLMVEVGEVVPAFEFGTGVFWITVLEMQEPVSLYNRSIQIALRNVLRWVQFNTEKERFVESLWGDGSLEEVKTMADRVTNIAIRRFQQ